MSLTKDFELVKINANEFSKHHDECLAIADQLFLVIPAFAELSVPLTNVLIELANRLDKSISKLPARFD